MPCTGWTGSAWRSTRPTNGPSSQGSFSGGAGGRSAHEQSPRHGVELYLLPGILSGRVGSPHKAAGVGCDDPIVLVDEARIGRQGPQMGFEVALYAPDQDICSHDPDHFLSQDDRAKHKCGPDGGMTLISGIHFPLNLEEIRNPSP